VRDVMPGFGQGAPDQQASMAIERIGLRAHRRQSVPPRFLDEPRQTFAKFR
jgi:hypothetical protein